MTTYVNYTLLTTCILRGLTFLAIKARMLEDYMNGSVGSFASLRMTACYGVNRGKSGDSLVHLHLSCPKIGLHKKV
jgi:hypothetical protein